VAVTEEFLVFVEVKTRSRHTAFHPSVSVTQRKMARLHGLGQHYRSLHPELGQQPRFDVISVVLAPEVQVEHLVNAF
jgi:Holliday junction resolvase-like predicted endonuclease